ncbi:MAG: carboxynorspermidine decarboxylase [Ruminococcus sp.]|nr:carboxynorspermidine decarboxylase [Ruminococcus sp.]
MFDIDISNLKTPCYLLDERLLIKNLEILKDIQDKTGCKILLAQKCFSMFSEYPLMAKYLSGTTASGLYEAKLGHDEFKKETHIFSPAYPPQDMDEILSICDHIVFNSTNQWKKYKDKVLKYPKHISCGLRINPEYSEIETDIYNPCFTGSRLGTTLANLNENSLDGLEGIHFHTMCEQGADTLKRTIKVVDQKFGKYIKNMKWINFGGGHHITKKDYDINTLIDCIMYFKNKYNNIDVYLEPGEAIALDCGYLISSVYDTINNGIDIAIVDTSAECHMPDVLEMPYRPNIIGSGLPNEKKYTYRLGGNTCLAGDIIGDYSFDKPLQEGNKLIFCDMAIYTMVKNNTFNGTPLPSIAVYRENEGIKVIKEFGYQDFKERLS